MDVEITPSVNERIIPIKILDTFHGKPFSQVNRQLREGDDGEENRFIVFKFIQTR